MKKIDFSLFDGVFSLSVSNDSLHVFAELSNALALCHEVCPHRKREIDDFFLALIRDVQFIAKSKSKKD